MQFANINGAVIHYQIIGGPKEKPTLVFVNALGSDFRIWRDVIVRFVGDHPMVTYDKRGHGLSETGKMSGRMEEHADDLAGLLDLLSVQNAVLVGLSVGGMISQLLASRRPDLASALVLCDTSYRIGSVALWAERMAAIKEGGMDVAAEAVAQRWFTKKFCTDYPDIVRGYQTLVRRMPVEGYMGTCQALRDTNLEEIAMTLPLPVSCIVGDQDVTTTPDIVGNLAKTIPGARYDVIENSGHMPCIEQPAILAEIIKGFLALNGDKN